MSMGSVVFPRHQRMIPIFFPIFLLRNNILDGGRLLIVPRGFWNKLSSESVL